MTRILFMLVVEVAGLAAMFAMRIEVPWNDLSELAATPEELVAAGLLRAGAIAVTGWLLASTLAYTVTAPIPWLRAAVGRLTAPAIRRIVDAGLAATLSLSVTPPAAASEAPPDPIVVTIDETDSGTTIVLPPGVRVSSPAPPVDTEPPPPRAPAPRNDQTIAPPRESTMFTTVESQVDAAEEPAGYVVQPGDHLWAIAEQVLMLRTGRGVIPDHDIAPYWRRLIEANRSSLRSGDPDLIYPGELLTIPDVTP
jgi:nucleoid-associated protein YgaU